MKIFLDSADVNIISLISSVGIIDGVTTNPSIIAKSGRDLRSVISEICSIVSGPVSAEVTSKSSDDMVSEGKRLAGIADNVCVKLPTTADGLRACKILSSEGIMVNMTLCFSVPQAVLVAKAGATFVSPFVGRWDDVSIDGMKLIEDIRLVYDNYEEFYTQILVASVRHPVHFVHSAKLGADAITIPPSLFDKLVQHPLTDQGIEIFDNDWKNASLS